VEEGGWLARNFKVHAMMDLSDGLGADLPRLAAASGCGYRIDHERLPRNAGRTIKEALGDGEDYELLIALAPRDAQRVRILWPRKFPKVGLTEIGELTAAVRKGGKGGKGDGYDHFA
jgi:thiamine-monophosphate kinase